MMVLCVGLFTLLVIPKNLSLNVEKYLIDRTINLINDLDKIRSSYGQICFTKHSNYNSYFHILLKNIRKGINDRLKDDPSMNNLKVVIQHHIMKGYTYVSISNVSTFFSISPNFLLVLMGFV